MSPKLSVHVMQDGERVPMLQDESGVPLFYPTLYATSQLRNAGVAVNTIRNKLADLIVLLRWEVANCRNLISEFQGGRFLTIADVVSLRDFAKLDMRNWKSDGHCTEKPSIRVLGFLEARVAPSRARAAIGSQQHFNRLSTIADYLEFTASVVTQHNGSHQMGQEIARMGTAIRKHRPRGLTKHFEEEPERRSPPTDLVNHFMAVGSERDSRNPFKHPDIRLRNAIIFGLLRHTGMRRGELLSLRLDQFDLGHEPLVWVRRNQDDKHDSRRYQPVAKTKERPLPLPAELAEQLSRYMLQVRAGIRPARRHPYLLISHRKGAGWGQPLSISALNSQIFGRMRAVDRDFELIHPHAFRHHFNYELSRSIDEHNAQIKSDATADHAVPISEHREQDVRAFLNGHRHRASGAAYNRRHIREVSEKAARLVQSGMIRKINKDMAEEDED
ncbi:site-specific integrase [Stenotrophomonas hibiscicola]|uniref:site-specific integrase n=1 Tax=Stenotrophomonas pavanii TaxID=487698 RepID=UPI0013DF966D|nr:site-specific integrase [Stenotrophomonas pavanii]NGM54195.1 site-specific integrase [Stenotrophomonas pavanii]